MRLLLVFFMIYGSVFSQETLDDHIKIVESSASKEEKIKAYQAIADLTYKKDDEVFIKYVNQLVDFALEIGEYDIAATNAIDLCTIYVNRLGQSEPTLSVIEKVLPYEDQLKVSKNAGGLYIKRAAYHYHGNSFEKAIEDYTNAINRYSVKDSIHKADATFFRGQAYGFTGAFVEAVTDYETAIKYYENLGDADYVMFTKAGLALLYSSSGFAEKALEIQEEVLEYAIKNEKYSTVGTTYYNMALQAKKLNDTAKEEVYLLKALETFPKAEVHGYQLAIAQSALAEFYAGQGAIDKADNYLKEIESATELLKNNKRIQSYYNVAKAKVEKLKGNYDNALSVLQKQKAQSEDWQNTTQLIQDQKLFYELYKLKGDDTKALQHFERYETLKDSLYNTQKTNTLLYYQNLFETERNERNLKEKEADIKLLQKDNTIKQNWLLFGGLGLTLLFGILYLLRGKVLSDRAKKMQETYSQNLILAQEDERKRIASELHDGVGQQLLLIKNQSIIENLENIKGIANQTINEVRSISMNLHPYQLKEFGLTKAILMNLKKYEQSAEAFVSFEVDDIDGLFKEIQEINIYRIIQECVSNMVKHANATATRIEVKRQENKVQILVNDNGKGYNVDAAFQGEKSLGLKTLKERTNLLDGTMQITSQKNKGTKIEFIIPYQKA